MVKLKGPSVSQEASGSLADVLTFQTGRKGSTAKAHAAPKQPQTGAQVSVRSMITFLSRWWATASAAQQDSWNDLARDWQYAPYHAYMKENMLRWKTFRTPSKQYPAAETLPTSVQSRPQATPGIASINVGLHMHPATNNKGSLLFRGPVTGFPLDIDAVVQVLPATPGITWTWWLDTPLASGTYWYNSQPFTVDGNLGAASGYRQAIIP